MTWPVHGICFEVGRSCVFIVCAFSYRILFGRHWGLHVLFSRIATSVARGLSGPRVLQSFVNVREGVGRSPFEPKSFTVHLKLL